ncbi:MAG: hypothetical protein D6705_04310 [Deltaproteobacteria bacterium]|nr:MAG: hypothetical protein D6705_04310 [Deltaproteobacteria bacterium]
MPTAGTFRSATADAGPWSRAARRPGVRLLLAVLVAVLCSRFVPDAHAAAAVDRRVDEVVVAATVFPAGAVAPGADGGRVPRNHGIVRGTVTYRLAPGDGVLVLADPARIPEALPAGLDPVAERAFADGLYETGHRTLRPLEGVAGMRDRGDGTYEIRIAPGADQVRLAFVLEVPRRPWPNGCVRGRCMLAGGLAPLPTVVARGGPFLPYGRVLAPATWHLDLTVAPPRRGPPPSVVIAGDGRRVAYPVVAWGRSWHVTRTVVRGVEVEIHAVHRRPSARTPDEWALSPHRDVAGRVDAIARESLEIAGALGWPHAPGRRLVVVQGPYRQAPAAAHPGLVALSDEAWEVVTLERFLRFHDLAVARAVTRALLEPWVDARADPSTAAYLAGLLAEPIVAVWQQARAHPDEYARDVLRRLTFMPVVDRFLQAGQASFASSYFRDLAHGDGRLLSPREAFHALPDGRFLAGKLADLLPAAALTDGIRRLLADPGRDVVATFGRAYGRRLDWFFDTWLGPPPRIDYGIVEARSERVPGGYRHRIVVEKRGVRPVVEPVQLYVRTRGREERFLVWNGQVDPSAHRIVDEPRRGRHVFEFDTRERLAVVRLDPRYRTVETPMPPKYNVHPRWNNRVPPAPRFLYTGAGLFVSGAEFATARTAAARWSAIDGFAFFEASRRNDLAATGHLQVFHDRETWVGGGFGANLWGGPMVNRRRRQRRIGFFQTVEWLNGQMLDPRGGVRLVETIRLADDDRGFFMWPERGRRFEAFVSARQTLRTVPPRDHRFDLAFGASWTQLVRAAVGHVFAFKLDARAMVPLAGTEPEFRGLVRGGGGAGLRAFTGNEIFGRAGVFVDAEYRHALVRSLHVDLAHLAYVREIGGVLLGGVASLSSCEGYADLFGRNSWFAQVGYGLYAKAYLLGLTPQLVRVEVAVPLLRHGRRCLGQTLPDYIGAVQGIDDVGRLLPPIAINLHFVQPF